MIISNNKKFIFISVPKTGTTNAEYYFLKNISDAKKTTDKQEGKKVFYSQLHKHSGIIDLSYFMESEYKKHFKVAFTRNPYDRVVSWFSYLTQNLNDSETATRHRNWYGTKYLTGNFKDFVKYAPDWCFANVVTYIMNSYGNIEVDYIGRYENYTEDMNYVCRKLKIPEMDNESHHNKSLHDNYINYYCNETRKIISNRMKLDIEYFKYKFGD